MADTDEGQAIFSNLCLFIYAPIWLHHKVVEVLCAPARYCWNDVKFSWELIKVRYALEQGDEEESEEEEDTTGEYVEIEPIDFNRNTDIKYIVIRNFMIMVQASLGLCYFLYDSDNQRAKKQVKTVTRNVMAAETLQTLSKFTLAVLRFLCELPVHLILLPLTLIKICVVKPVIGLWEDLPFQWEVIKFQYGLTEEDENQTETDVCYIVEAIDFEKKPRLQHLILRRVFLGVQDAIAYWSPPTKCVLKIDQSNEITSELEASLANARAEIVKYSELETANLEKDNTPPMKVACIAEKPEMILPVTESPSKFCIVKDSSEVRKLETWKRDKTKLTHQKMKQILQHKPLDNMYYLDEDLSDSDESLVEDLTTIASSIVGNLKL